jgi:hypothetical protein
MSNGCPLFQCCPYLKSAMKSGMPAAALFAGSSLAAAPSFKPTSSSKGSFIAIAALVVAVFAVIGIFYLMDQLDALQDYVDNKQKTQEKELFMLKNNYNSADKRLDELETYFEEEERDSDADDQDNDDQDDDVDDQQDGSPQDNDDVVMVSQDKTTK